ncbi:unnamed protein product [Durusdinium trenchii]|uniref:Uncharacterized protein n=1 Tax=Durusdinium trenchii TaxID=1381693 RepID=A0ABP0JL88_9DINO
MAWRHLQRWLEANPVVKRSAIIAAKGVVGASAGAVGLALQYETPVDVWREASLDVRSSGASSSAASALASVRSVCARNQIQEEDFWAAAKRLRPVEQQLEELHALGLPKDKLHAREDELAAKWKEKGYFDPKRLAIDRATLFGRRLTSDAQGVDIGLLVPPYLPLHGKTTVTTGSVDAPATSPVSWSQDMLQQSEKALDTWGFVLLRGLLTPEDVQSLRCALGLDCKDKRAPPRRAAEVGLWQQQQDPNVSMGRYTYGRLHLLLRGSPQYEMDAVSPHASVAPLVHKHFEIQDMAGNPIFLSEAQLVIADPCAETQQWHIESATGKGLSIFIPLGNVALDRGLQELLPGTHVLHDPRHGLRDRWRRCLRSLCATHGGVLAMTDNVWSAGDALVLDSGTLHRGLANDSLGAPVPVLVLRYDPKDRPAPGCRRSWLLTMTRMGQCLSNVFHLYSWM